MKIERKPKIVAIVGPTASGKSDLAVKIAKKYNGEVISADSRQIYTGLNIGTGKITKEEMCDVPHHLLDVADPKKRFTVHDYKTLADKAIVDIVSRGKLPIICGGTGFYVDNVVKNITLPDVPVNMKLRKSLSQKTALELFKMLKEIDSKRADEIGGHNKVRLIRALEIANNLGSIPKLKSEPLYETLQIGIQVEPDILKEKIQKRLLSRIDQGMIDEAKKLHQKGLSWKRMEELGLEYRYQARFLQNKITLPEMIERLQIEIWHYARRQRQWFGKNQNIKWLSKDKEKNAFKLVEKFLK